MGTHGGVKTDLPELKDYSYDEIARAEKLSPAVQRYLQLINNPAVCERHPLHVTRHKAWLRSAIPTLLEKSSAEEICRAWSRATDEIINQYWNQWPEENKGLGLFALGKWG